MSLFDGLDDVWQLVTADESQLPTCPECAERIAEEYPDTPPHNRPSPPTLTQDYVRQPAFQDHWRGVPAWVCEECDYAEYREG